MAEKPLHSEHRARMRNRFAQNGLDGFEEHQILEMLLFSCIPRKDTNGIAHHLINRFGSLNGVLTADQDELCKVEGIGKTSAAYIHFLGEAFGYMTDRLFRDTALTSRDAIALYASVRMATLMQHSAEAAFTDENGTVISSLALYRGERRRTGDVVAAVMKAAAECHAYGIILMHDHTGEPLIASPDDDLITEKLRHEAKAAGITSVEHVITSEEGTLFI